MRVHVGSGENEYTVQHSWLSGAHVFRILMQLTKFSKRIYHFYKVTSETKLSWYMFICHDVVLPATARSAAILSHAGAITVGAS